MIHSSDLRDFRSLGGLPSPILMDAAPMDRAAATLLKERHDSQTAHVHSTPMGTTTENEPWRSFAASVPIMWNARTTESCASVRPRFSPRRTSVTRPSSIAASRTSAGSVGVVDRGTLTSTCAVHCCGVPSSRFSWTSAFSAFAARSIARWTADLSLPMHSSVPSTTTCGV